MDDLTSDLLTLAQLHEGGVLTDDEFTAAKRARIEAGGKPVDRSVVGGSVLAPAGRDANCPVCGKDDQVARTSHVAASGVSAISLAGSVAGGGVGASFSFRTWRPLDMGSYYTTSTGFRLTASLSLSGQSASTLAAAMSPPELPEPIPDNGDPRYARYCWMVSDFWDRSYYCSRDGIVFIKDSDYPPIAPADYQAFLHYEPVRRIGEQGIGTGMQRCHLPRDGFSLSVPETWVPIERSEPSRWGDIGWTRAGFGPEVRTGFQPFIAVGGGFWLGQGRKGDHVRAARVYLENPEKVLYQPLGHRFSLAGQVSKWQGKRVVGCEALLSVAGPAGAMVGWAVAFEAKRRRWALALVTHPAVVPLDSLVFAEVIDSIETNWL